MTVIEIVLLVLGALIFAASFIIPEKMSRKNEDNARGMGGAVNDINAREMVETMKEDIERQVRLAVDTSAEVAVEDVVLRTERNLEKLTNEKMMAIDEYAQTVIQDINKNHKEVVFLYDMLENKTTDIKNTVRKAESTKTDIEEAGKKVRAELETIARRSAETVIANSERRAEKRTMVPPEREQPELRQAVHQVQTVPHPVREERAALIDEEPYRESVRQVEEPKAQPEPPKREKGVPRLGRAAAAAFAQAAAMSAQESAPAYEEETNPPVQTVVEAGPLLTRTSGVMSVQDDNLHYVDTFTENSYGTYEEEQPQQEEAESSEDLNGLVISMHKAGIDDVEIARRLSIGVGEVRLMIGLYG